MAPAHASMKAETPSPVLSSVVGDDALLRKLPADEAVVRNDTTAEDHHGSGSVDHGQHTTRSSQQASSTTTATEAASADTGAETSPAPTAGTPKVGADTDADTDADSGTDADVCTHVHDSYGDSHGDCHADEVPSSSTERSVVAAVPNVSSPSALRRSSMRKPSTHQRRSPSVCFDSTPNIIPIPSHKKMTRKQKQKQWCTDKDLENAKEECLRTMQHYERTQYVIQPSQLRGLEMFSEEVALHKARISMHSIAAVLQEQYNQKRRLQHFGSSTSTVAAGLDDQVLSKVYMQRTEQSRRSAAELGLIDQEEVQEYIQNAEEEVRKEHAAAAAAASNKTAFGSRGSRQLSSSSTEQVSSSGCFGMRVFKNPFRKKKSDRTRLQRL